MFQRKVYGYLKNWKEESNGSSAVLIEGARRVGKSTTAEAFAKTEYDDYILIDFSTAEQAIKDNFDNIGNLDTFFRNLFILTGKTLQKRRGVIIFDEVQFFPKARQSVKQLVKDGRFDYIETGSLISIKKNVKDILIPSEEESIKMYPMDFEEFLMATNNDDLIELIRTCFESKKPLGQALHRKLITLFRTYLIVGGMPQAVKEFIRSDDFNLVDEVKRDILSLYLSDISKHTTKQSSSVLEIFNEIPSSFTTKEHKFNLANIQKGAKYRDYEDAFFWLSDAMIINNCYNTTEPNIGLRINRNRVSMKCYMADTGLLISHAFDENGLVSSEVYKKILFNKLEVNLGMILENIVSQMFVANNKKLYFYSNSSRDNKLDRMEIDFLICKKVPTNSHNISPIEVKSGKNYTLTSIKKFMVKYKNYLNQPYVIHMDDLKENNEILYIPFYMAYLL